MSRKSAQRFCDNDMHRMNLDQMRRALVGWWLGRNVLEASKIRKWRRYYYGDSALFPLGERVAFMDRSGEK
jgi:hypothetical protein